MSVEKTTEDNKEQVRFDPEAFKKEIFESQKELVQSLGSELKEELQATLSSFQPSNEPEYDEIKTPRETKSEILDEYEEHLEEIGVEGKQAEHLIKLMDKFITKKISGFEGSILSKVDRKESEKDQKIAYTQEAASLYPQILDKKSELFRMSQQVYKKMSNEAKKAPDAELIAVERAAARLGIKAADPTVSNSYLASNPTGSVGGNTKKKDKEISEEFASFFGVDHKKVNEKLKALQ